ncbi:MAG: DUF5615 family PIN-like protein [Nitrososphaerota archaeon]|nr:DUF5615 family PIN-like protein [Nitrososphaerota archaeon]
MRAGRLRVLVDESTGRRLSELLGSAGHDSVFVGDVTPGAADEEVLSRAEQEGRILITDDKDFGELVFRLGRPTSGVILLRGVEGSHEDRMKVLARVLQIEGLAGSFVTVRKNRVRVRRAPR